MNKLTFGRGAFYAVGLAGFLSLLAMIAATAGYGTFENGMYDPPPIDVKWLATVVVSGIGNGLAFVAVWMGWGGRASQTTTKTVTVTEPTPEAAELVKKAVTK